MASSPTYSIAQSSQPQAIPTDLQNALTDSAPSVEWLLALTVFSTALVMALKQ